MTLRRVLLNWKALVGIAVSLGLLYFALRDVDPGQVIREIRTADPLLFIASIGAATFLFVLRAIRWRALLDPVLLDSPFGNRFAATTIGFMANNLLPARMGEFARAYAYSRMERVSMSASFGSIVLERLFDGLTLFLFLFLAMATPGFPAIGTLEGWDINGAALMLLLGVLAAAAALLATVIWPERTVRLFERMAALILPQSFRRPVVDALAAFLHGVRAIREPRLVLRAAFWSLVLWTVGALGFWLGFRAFGIDVSFAAALFIQSLVSLAVSLPSAPGYFGTFEYGVRLGLVSVFGVEMNKAMGFALGFHIGGYIPVTLLGLFFVWRLGLSWREVEESEEIVELAVEEGDDVAEAAVPEPGRTAP